MRGLLAGLLAFAVYLALQAVVFCAVKISRRALMLVGLWVVGLPVFVAIYALLPDDHIMWPSMLSAPSDITTLVSGGLIYFFLFMGYAQFFYMAESSVGVRTMIELSSEPTKGLTSKELTGRYRFDWMLERRLHRLVHAGYLVEENGWYRTTMRGRITAALLTWCKQFLRLGPGG